ncbi:hypothetical protein T4B_13921 [Trichinella pseudospiralis]|uniref:Uncharacterized protein n=1 Tax=Trichinella pseudospiralis TaxID=6337 RepID=A0A0V1IDI0_TRIPS|nr:hypothetical protein T4B_13921 [Trichinella pseudospiralis]KRZ42411.1 hypothetical protein T4C_12170 [Trichinella pseudospiralis]
MRGKLLSVVYCLTVKKDLPTYSRIFEVLHSKAEELGVQLDPAKFVCNFKRALIPAIQVLQSPLSQYPGARLFLPLLPSCASAAFLPVNLVLAGFEILNVKTSDPVEALFEYFQREWLPAIKIPLWNVHGVFLQLIIDEQGKTENVVRKMDDGYTWEKGSVKRSAAYRVQQRRVAALTARSTYQSIANHKKEAEFGEK